MRVRIPATSANLGSGFDALGLALSLYNEVIITPASFSSVSINGEGAQSGALKRNNLFLNIFNEIYLELTGKTDTFRIVFDNQIPFSRGLGSSSAVIVSAIAAAYGVAGFKVNKQSVLNRALFYENHPDNIAPATLGGFVCSIVKNGRVIFNKFDLSNDIKAVVVIPDKPMSTSQSRSVLPKSYTAKECVHSLSHAALLSSCFASGRFEYLRYASEDVMHEPYRIPALPELAGIREVAYENGALLSTLSGSGSSFLNIVYADDAARLHGVLSDKFSHFRVEIFEFDNDGFILES
ncbi:homoserine kinase [Campylobacter sp. 19-13652]|uniref:homoserine kinase n=1 Tax=Campylobacter sp. 19-13652 TaxID=2840180 RepID=UPI001C786CB2|nr:homoserine kinase [Campylobacter sp. 19-13652]BCX79871.1 homoserine kinase [Campylobacter sp. 19-13652]